MDIWKAPASLEARPSDVTIIVDGCEFRVHKDILIENCDYFKAMFSSQMLENWQNEINIKIVEKTQFEMLIGGFYSGQLDLSYENVFSICAACHVLQVTSLLFTQCCDFLKSLINHEHCFEVLNFTTLHPIQEVYNLARRYCLHHFLTLNRVPSFLSLSLNDVTNYLSDDYLVADGTWEILEALKNWCSFNGSPDPETLKAVISACLHSGANMDECECIALAIISGDNFHSQKWAHLGPQRCKKDTFMFWSRLSKTKTRGLVDVIKLGDLEACQESICGSRYDTMTHVVEDPGFDLGSAVCVKGPYVYICGGGPSFGRMNWIRDIWRFSAFEDKNRWSSIGKLPETRRYHAMVAVNSKLYVFGGFGKFRSKNCCLESFDIHNGLWETLSPMPKHEFKPIATSHHQAMYYISQQWNVYEYRVSSDQWNSCQELISLEKFIYPHNRNDLCTPVALHVSHVASCEPESSLTFTVLSTGKSFQIVSCPLSRNSNPSLVQDFDHVKFFGSCSLNNKVLLFLRLECKDEDEHDEVNDEDENSEERTDMSVICFEPQTNSVKKVTTITNVRKGSSIVPIPHVPKQFQIDQHIRVIFPQAKT